MEIGLIGKYLNKNDNVSIVQPTDSAPVERVSQATAIEDRRDDRWQKVKPLSFQVDSRFRRYWSKNEVWNPETETLENQLRWCPFCKLSSGLVEIEVDEHGHPHCLNCGTIFPLPESKKAEEERGQMILTHKFMRDYYKEFERQPRFQGRLQKVKHNHNQEINKQKESSDFGRQSKFRATTRF